MEITNMEKIVRESYDALQIAMRSFKKRLWSDSFEEDVEVDDKIPGDFPREGFLDPTPRQK